MRSILQLWKSTRHIRTIHFPEMRQHYAHLKYRDDFKVTWLFAQCLNKPFISFKAAELKCFLPCRARISVIKLAWVKEILRKNQWKASLIRWVYLRSVILFFPSYTFSNTFQRRRSKHMWNPRAILLWVTCLLSTLAHPVEGIYGTCYAPDRSTNILREDINKNKMSKEYSATSP